MGTILSYLESQAHNVNRFELFTGEKSAANLKLYQNRGYVISKTETVGQFTIFAKAKIKLKLQFEKSPPWLMEQCC